MTPSYNSLATKSFSPISPKHALISEIASVVSAMCKDSRLSPPSLYATPKDYSQTKLGTSMGLRNSSSSHASNTTNSEDTEAGLMLGMLQLKRVVTDMEDISQAELPSILSPFFDILQSPLSTSPVTSTILIALHNFFLGGLIQPTSPGLNVVLSELSITMSQLNGHVISSSSDEVVLLKIMIVIQDCVCGPVGRNLGDVDVCQMIEAVLRSCCQKRLSEILRQSAEEIMHALVRTVFGTLTTLDPLVEESKLDLKDRGVDTKTKCDSSATDNTGHKSLNSNTHLVTEGSNEFVVDVQNVSTSHSKYGLPSILELLHPSDQQHTNSTRLVALGTLNAVFEEAGSFIPSFPSLRSVVADTGCKFLFQLARSENLSVFQAALHTISTIFIVMRRHLKLQHELFIAFCMDRLALPASPTADNSQRTRGPSNAVPQSTHVETRDLILQTLRNISDYPSFMVDLYINYDCDMNCEHTFEKVIDFLTKNIVSAPHVPDKDSDIQHKNSQYLCLDLLLAFVDNMAKRIDRTYPTVQSLLQAKSRKQLAQTGATRFNSKPKARIVFLEENKLIYSDLQSNVSKAERKPVADALRELLETFRLPGEAQQIGRITETFASTYFASDPVEIKDKDAVYVLTYSMILLNTDLHNSQVRKRMSFEDYQKNLRGVNGGSDFSNEFLQDIYESIKKKEIILPEEHRGQLRFEYAWKELLLRSKQSGEFLLCNSSSFDLEMFKTIWEPVISSVIQGFINFDDEYIIQKAIAGFRQCAMLADHFQLPEALDFTVTSLSKLTNLLSEAVPANTLNRDITTYVDGRSLTVSKLSVNFGKNFKGQLSTVILFNIVKSNGNAIREGWMQIFEVLQNLFLHSLLPIRMLQMQGFLGEVTTIPLRVNQPRNVRVRSDGGLLSTLSSYLITPYSSKDDVHNATEAEMESTLCTVDCIMSCQLEEFYGQIIIDALVAALHEHSVVKLKLHSEEGSGSYKLPYDAASIFLLEKMVSITCQSSACTEDLWPIVFGHISVLLSTPTQYSALLIERAIISLLRLCRTLAKNPKHHEQIHVSLVVLSELPPSVASSFLEQIVTCATIIVKEHRDIIRFWNAVATLFRATVSHPEVSMLVFNFISTLILDGPEQNVSPYSFPGLVILLDDFARAANSWTENQRHTSKEECLSSLNSLFVERGKTSINLISRLHHIHLSWDATTGVHSTFWHELVLPLLTTLSRQSTNSVPEIRNDSLRHLQRILLGPKISPIEMNHSHLEDIFNRVLFPIIDELLKPDWDPNEISEIRLYASALLCKAFIHLEVQENNVKLEQFRVLWIQILDLMDRLMNIEQDVQLYEAIPESLKNVLLVMNSEGVLVPRTTGDDLRDKHQQMLWTTTQCS
ncbi:Sec7-domain-containing protein [Cyathus striatus]|nr:Sec7-domain-containing protein [Cyathus striatus]